jgi:hypothetical protein
MVGRGRRVAACHGHGHGPGLALCCAVLNLSLAVYRLRLDQPALALDATLAEAWSMRAT